MSEEDELIDWEETLPPSHVERLTAQFYAWEMRGRGWDVWPYPVELEPAFEPFYGHFVPPVGRKLDDARKPTVLSVLAERARGWIVGRPAAPGPTAVDLEEEPWEPEPEPFEEESPLLALQITLPPDLKVTRDGTEAFLLSLSSCRCPVSFEVVGTEGAIMVQFSCREPDLSQLNQQLGAHFPEALVLEEGDLLRRSWEQSAVGEVAVVDFGLSQEFMRPLRTFGSFEPDPLTGIFGALGELAEGDVGVLQVLFQPARNPWADSVLRAVTDSAGGSFFADSPEMVSLAKAKVTKPLLASIVRVAAKSPSETGAWRLARALGGPLRQFSSPPSNELIPLEPRGLSGSELEADLLDRTAHRTGMLLNSEELLSLVHLPSASVRAPKLARMLTRTRAAPETATGHRLVLGENVHAGKTTVVTPSPTLRTRHTYLVGASGTGKSHLLLNLIIQDLEDGAGVGVLDPHGDLIDRVMGHVPEERMEDVVFFEPADPDYAVGFNVLQAHSDLEKDLLASDLVSVFQRLATSWGDQMTAILANAVLAFLESEQGGTLADLRRFLVDKEFRREYLATVKDPEVVFFWEKEFPLISGKPQAPILTRLNTFLRHRLIRHIVAQKESRLDFGEIMNDGKILLAKLAQGQIGHENAYLLGSLLVSKFQQLALARQELAEEERRPFYLYIDEFHNFATPSMAEILAGARKYSLGLTLAHQDLQQLRSRDQELLSAVLTNPATRVCFRVGDMDARKLAEGFASFDASDLQQLSVGEAICRIERADWDFNLRTLPLPPLDAGDARSRRQRIVEFSRDRYATPRTDVEEALKRAATSPEEAPEGPLEAPERPPEPAEASETAPGPAEAPRAAERTEKAGRPTQKAPPRPRPSAATPLGRGGPEHIYLQELIKRWAQAHEWQATIEEPVLDGQGSVDVALEKGGLRIACEVSVSSSPDQELRNVQKCLAAGFDHVVVLSKEKKTLRKAKKQIGSELDEESLERVHFLTPDELFSFLEEREAEAATAEETVRGYRVTTRYKAVEEEEKESARKTIVGIITKGLKRLGSDKGEK